MSRSHSITFEPTELDRLLKVLYSQTAIADEYAIGMIAKINDVVRHNSPLNSPDLTTTAKLQHSSLTDAAEIYHRYRTDHPVTADASSPPPKPFSDPLSTIANTLETIAAHLTYPYPQSLGFTAHYRKEMIYCEAQYGSYWHLLNEWQQPIPLNARALTCMIQALKVVRIPPEASDQSGLKLHLHVQADKPYCLESPCTSLFSKTLLLSLAHLPPQQLRSPITIEPTQSRHKNSLICRLYCRGTPIVYTVPTAIHWPALITSIQHTLERNIP